MSQLSTRLRILIIAIGVCVALSPFLFNSLNPYTDEGMTSPSNMLQLEAPPFMRGVEAASLSQNSNVNYGYFSDNAGIAAYTQLELTADDLNTFKDSDIITVSGEEEGYYVAGTMTALGYEGFPQPIIERMDIQIYVDINGWVVAFLQKDEPASRIINWPQLSSKPITLISSIQKIADIFDILVDAPDVSLYDFSNEDATGIFIAGDVARNEDGEVADSFKVTIPRNFSIRHASWSHMVDHVTTSHCGIEETNTMFLEDGIKQSDKKWMETGQIDSITGGNSYTIYMNKKINMTSRNGPVYCGIVLIYRERGNQ